MQGDRGDAENIHRLGKEHCFLDRLAKPHTLAFKIEHLGYWAKWNGELVLEPKIFRSDI